MMKWILIILSLVFQWNTDSYAQNRNNNLLINVYNKLNGIHDADYIIHVCYKINGDTIVNYLSPSHEIEMINPKDTTIGSSLLKWNDKEYKDFSFGYDGYRKATVYKESKMIRVYDYIKTPHPHGKIPFRPLSAPFFNYTKSIIYYALNTKDTISVSLQEDTDDFCFKITINEDKMVEFFGRDYKMEDPLHLCSDPTMIYELWINKNDSLPYKYMKTRYDGMNSARCDNVKINQLNIDSIDVRNYFQPDYDVQWFHDKQTKKDNKANSLIGKKMAHFELYDSNDVKFYSSKSNSKIMLIEFTGVGCGPCLISIPFLNDLRDRYSVEDLQVLAIESWKRSASQIKFYIEKNSVNYPFLIGNNDVFKNFCGENTSVPQFFIVDKDGIIRYHSIGFNKDLNGKEMEGKIKELIN